MGHDPSQIAMLAMAWINKSGNNNIDWSIVIMALIYFIFSNKNYINDFFNKTYTYIFNEKWIKITFTSHEVPIRSYSNAQITKKIYSENMMALLFYIEKNNKVHNLNSILEILTIFNIDNGCYDADEKRKNKFSYIPHQNEDILLFDGNSSILLNEGYLHPEDIRSSTDGQVLNGSDKILHNSYIYTDSIQIYANFKINEDDGDDHKDDKSKTISVKKKTYQSTIMIKKNKLDSISDIQYLNILQKFLDKIIKEYRFSFKDKDSDKLYIYVYRNSINEDGIIKLNFDKYNSEHNKDLNNNIFFEGKNDLIKYITPFIYNPSEITNKGEEKYTRLGCTFKAGLFFCGYPGCGKTSTIKAILKYTNRHGIVIDLKKIKTCEELETLFRIKKIHENEYSSKQLCFILEDCDASDNNILKDRAINMSDVQENISMNDMKMLNQCKENSNNELLTVAKSIEETLKNKDDALNLSCFLNVLDGIIELHGIMIIMTSNHPEKIDAAVLREGRFDFKYEFKKSSRNIIREMLQHNYQLTLEEINKFTNISNIKDYILSPAKIQKICFKHDNINDCINEILFESQ
jgi:ABC-type dipeptide/oligopeptide/nickel transport system ATPase subunit